MKSEDIQPTYRFIKYYESHKLAVNVEIGENLFVKTAYEITNNNLERQGMLMMIKRSRTNVRNSFLQDV